MYVCIYGWSMSECMYVCMYMYVYMVSKSLSYFNFKWSLFLIKCDIITSNNWLHIVMFCVKISVILMDEWMDGWMYAWMDEWMDGWMDEWMDGWMNGWMDK